MKRYILTLALLVMALAPLQARDGAKKTYVIGFYNLENLFDTYHD